MHYHFLKLAIRRNVAESYLSKFLDIRRGFTIVETLIVVLIIGIISATGLSLYSGVTSDSQVRTMNDSLQVFFSACRHRAKYRGIPIKIGVRNRTLVVSNTNTLLLEFPALTDTACNLIDGMTMTASQTFDSQRRVINSMQLSVLISGAKLATLSISL